MSTSGKIGVKGMKPTGNELTLAPGSLTDCFGMVMPTAGVIRQVRGMTGSVYVDNDSADANANRPKELYQWGPHLLVNYTGSGGYRLSSFSNFASSPTYANVGSYAPPDPTVMRMKFAELAKSLYWTTDAGLYTLDSITGTARAAGWRRPVIYLADGDTGLYTRLSGNPNATGSWMPKNSAVAYRAAAGKKDANGRIVLSEASGRVVVVNPADVTVAIGGLVRNANVVTATVASHKFREGDVLDLTVSGGDVGNFDTTNNVVTSVTSTTIVWAETAANYTNVAQVTITSGTKSVQIAVGGLSGSVAGDFVQVFRTDETAAEGIDPGDEVFLAYERLLTAADISAGYVTITDTTPGGFLGDPLDSNANTGDGLLGINTRPPICRDVCQWDGRLWGAHTTDVHRLRIRLLGTGTPNGLQSGDLLAINTRVLEAGVNFGIYTQYLPTENVARTTYDLATFGPGSLVGLDATQTFDGGTGLGVVTLEQSTVASTMADGAGGAVSAIYAATSRTSAFGDALAATKAITAANTSRTGSTVTVRCTAHGFAVGQVVMLARAASSATDADFPLGLKTVASVVDANNFTYTESGAADTLVGTYYAYATTYKSDNNQQPVRFSRPGIPEAWPLANTIGGLPDRAEVLRIHPTPDGGELLVCLKNGDTYAIGGQYPYSVRRVDGTAPLVFADTLKEHAGRLYGITTQGICTLGSNGVGLVGFDTEDDIRTIIAGILAGDTTAAVPYAMSYESDRRIDFVTPTITASSGAIGAANARSYVLHSLRNEFTKLTTAYACGLVLKGSDYIVAGQTSSNRLLVERKGMGTDGLDYAGQVYTLTVNGTQSNVSTITVNSGGGSANFFGNEAVVIAGAYYRITAATATSITISGTVTVSNGDTLTAYSALFSSLTFAVESAGVPGIEKQFRELQLHFGTRLFYTLSVGFSSEHSASSSSVTVTPSDFAYRTPTTNPTTIRIEVPDAMKQAALLKVTVQMTGALWYFNLLGYSVTYEPISERTGK